MWFLGRKSGKYLNMTHVYLIIYVITIYHMKRDKFYLFRKYPHTSQV
jgi:hypothetical protein